MDSSVIEEVKSVGLCNFFATITKRVQNIRFAKNYLSRRLRLNIIYPSLRYSIRQQRIIHSNSYPINPSVIQQSAHFSLKGQMPHFVVHQKLPIYPLHQQNTIKHCRFNLWLVTYYLCGVWNCRESKPGSAAVCPIFRYKKRPVVPN